MKTFLGVCGILAVVLALAGIATGIGTGMEGFTYPQFGVRIHNIPNPIGAALGLLIAAVAIVFALAVTVVALAGAFLALVFALVLTGLILLAVALPFLLPLIIPLVLILGIVFATRRSSPARTA